MPDIVSGPPVVACGSSPDDLIPIGDLDPHTNEEEYDDDDVDVGTSGKKKKKKKSPRFLTGGSSQYAFSAFFSQLLFRTGRGKVGSFVLSKVA